MKDFRNDRFGGSGRDSYGKGGGRPTMHKAICSNCERPCEVPFMPTGDKPVYCSKCFEKTGNANPRRSERRHEKKMYSVTCDDCGNRCEVPFRPSGGKPVYCKQCFGKDGGNAGGAGGNFRAGGNKPSPDQYKQQFEMLNNKLDRILKILAPALPQKSEKKVEVIAAAVKDSKVKTPARNTKKAPAKKTAVKKSTAKKKKKE